MSKLLADEHAERNEHIQHGYHKTHMAGFVNGHLEETCLPDFAAEIDLKNGWHEESDEQIAKDAERFEDLARQLGDLMRWFSESKTIESAGRKALALVYAVAPHHFGGRSLRQLAKDLNTTAQSISKHSAVVSMISGGMETPTLRGREDRVRAAAAHVGKTSRPHGRRNPYSRAVIAAGNAALLAQARD